MLQPSQPKVSKAAHQDQDPIYALLRLPVSLCPCCAPWYTMDPEGLCPPRSGPMGPQWGTRSPVMCPPQQRHRNSPAQGPLSPMQVPLRPLLCPQCPGLGEAECGWGGCLAAPSPCPHGSFAGSSNEHHPVPHGCSTPGCLAPPRGSAAFGGGLSPYPPQTFLPTPLQGAPGGDRDTGTGSVKIKTLFDWLDIGV